MKQEKRPVLADFRSGGHLDIAADVVLGLNRVGYYHPDPSFRDRAEICILKNKKGVTVTLTQTFEQGLFCASEYFCD